MARGDDDNNGISPLILISGIIVVAGLAFGSAYLILGNSSSDQLVVIKAPTTPVRIAPEDPGGLKLNSIDSPVMDLLVEQANNDEKDAEILVPPVSEPELPPIDVAEENNQVSNDNSADQNSLATESTDNTPSTATEDIVKTETIAEQAADKSAEAPKSQTSSQASGKTPETKAPISTETTETAATVQANPKPSADDQAQPQDEISDAISSLSSNPTPKPKTPKIVSTTDNDAPSFVVQFAAFKSETRAKNTAAVLATKHASRLGQITLGYMKRDDFWRVVTEPMPRADATSLCRMFRSAGQDCITKLMEQPQ